MYRQLFLTSFIFVFFFTTLAAQNPVTKKLIGKWEGNDAQNQFGRIEFLDSARMKIYIPSEGSYTCAYSLDASKDPMWLDIIVQNGNDKQILRGLVKFLNDTTLKWQIFPDTTRPNSFQKETDDNTILLKKKS